MEPEVTASPDAAMVIKLTLDAFTAEKLLLTKPRSLPTATFCAFLIEQALDMPSRLPAYRVGAGTVSHLPTEQTQLPPATTVSIADEHSEAKQALTDSAPLEKTGCQTIDRFFGEGVGKESEETPRKPLSLDAVPPAKPVRKHVRREYTPEFQQFWNVYQTSPIKANSQSKPLAFEAWKHATQDETAERVIEAARRAVEQARQAKIQDEWFAPLPDAFRWLRDERYSVLLEDHVPVGPRVINGITVYD